MLTFELIKQAAARIAGRVHRTPVMTSRSFNEVAGREVFFKCENLQRAGAFKARGATNKILSLSDEEKQRGVIAVSSGNHAQAVRKWLDSGAHSTAGSTVVNRIQLLALDHRA